MKIHWFTIEISFLNILQKYQKSKCISEMYVHFKTHFEFDIFYNSLSAGIQFFTQKTSKEKYIEIV